MSQFANIRTPKHFNYIAIIMPKSFADLFHLVNAESTTPIQLMLYLLIQSLNSSNFLGLSRKRDTQQKLRICKVSFESRTMNSEL